MHILLNNNQIVKCITVDDIIEYKIKHSTKSFYITVLYNFNGKKIYYYYLNYASYKLYMLTDNNFKIKNFIKVICKLEKI